MRGTSNFSAPNVKNMAAMAKNLSDRLNASVVVKGEFWYHVNMNSKNAKTIYNISAVIGGTCTIYKSFDSWEKCRDYYMELMKGGI